MKKRNLFVGTWLVFNDEIIESCKHDMCNCQLVITGAHPLLEGYRYVIQHSRWQESVAEWVQDFLTRYPYSPYGIEPGEAFEERNYVLSRLSKSDNIQLIVPPIAHVKWPNHPEVNLITEDGMGLARMADLHYAKTCLGIGHAVSATYYHNRIWKDHLDEVEMEVPKLQDMILRKFSIYNRVYGKIRGRYPFTLSVKNLYPHKWADAIIGQSRKTREPVSSFKEVFKDVEKAVEIFRFHNDLEKHLGKHKPQIKFDTGGDIYLGSSAGLRSDIKKSIKIDDKTSVQVSSSGKKFENFQNDMEEVLEFLKNGTEPSVFWNQSEKVEVFFDFIKRLNDEDFFSWIMKCRIFVIPSSVYVLMERLVSKLRQKIEHGRNIKIGMKWVHGGADVLAASLGVDSTNEWKRIIVEGDLKKMDQSTIAYMVDKYFSHMLDYDDTQYPGFQIRKKIVEFLAKNIVQRITHLIGELWGLVIGGVPSGCFNTSHMDSWVMCMYILMWFIHIIQNAPSHMKSKLEEYLYFYFRYVVYGDDHLWNKSQDPEIAIFLSGDSFARYMKKFFDVDVRDIVETTFLSSFDVYGDVVLRGAVFLRHHFILNPHSGEGQPRYLPFRPTSDYLVRAFIGTDGRPRMMTDIMCSAIGHAYATCGANKVAYEMLRCVYQMAASMLQLAPGHILADYVGRQTNDDVRTMRRRGITAEELMRGFPSYAALIEKNKYRAVEHDHDESYLDIEDYDF